MGSKKVCVKKTKGNSYLAQKQAKEKADKEIYTMRIIAYQQQEMIDAFAITMNQIFGWGETRLKRWHDAFEEKYAEIQHLRIEDLDTLEYSEACIERGLQQAWGKHYVPRKERYAITLKTSDGKELHLFE